jgi:hypothetical protein
MNYRENLGIVDFLPNFEYTVDGLHFLLLVGRLGFLFDLLILKLKLSELCEVKWISLFVLEFEFVNSTIVFLFYG